MRFEWDPPKAEANLRAHGVSFAEAVTVLEDDLALTREDAYAVEEPRFAGSERPGKPARRGVRVPRPGNHPCDLGLESEQTPEGAV